MPTPASRIDGASPIGGARPADGGSRIDGVDIARGIAVLGMFVAHVLPDGETENLADGRSSVLFATLAGVSLGLVTGGASPAPRGSRRKLAGSVALRGIALILLGLFLWTLDSGIAIILDYYGVFFLVLLPVLFAPRAVLAPLALACATVGTAVLAEAPASPRELIGGDLLLWLPTEWFVTGYYPGLLWLGYVLVGLIVARSDLRRRTTQAAMAVGGAAASAFGYGGAILFDRDASAHSNTLWEGFGAGGLAIAVIGVLLLATANGSLPARALWPLGSVGRMPLSVYTAQILVLAVFEGAHPGGATAAEEWILLAGLVVGSLVFAAVWRVFLGKGPLERAMSAVSGLA
ncbi:DUF418 domain-containing protein [Naasia sp. SYSU D00057]|uniref:DUF418 domain-containing protein n=1 Tax=Naasia sp. SYSU D00057 TaxID=2817380 RepID=UPI001B30659A|nr:DUF418 domain-containing protein [Naasia sp. SYSU D00057]